MKGVRYCILMTLAIVILFVLNLLIGSIKIPASDVFSILLGDESQKASWRSVCRGWRFW